MNRDIAILCFIATLSVGLSACDSNTPRDQEMGNIPQSDAGRPTSGVLEYHLEWDTEGVERIETGWELVTDLGYTVQIEWGYVVTYSVSLVPCPMASLSPVLQLIEWVFPSAYAGHGDIADQSAIEASIAESLLDMSSRVIRRTDMSESRYCDAFILFARGDLGTITDEADLDADGISVTLRGRWLPPGGMTPTPLVIETDLARGELQSSFDQSADALINRPIEIGPDSPGARIRFVRSLSTLFDGIDFETALERTVARGVLRNLAEKTTFSRE